MCGKYLNTTGVCGPIWTIFQLRFSDRAVNVRRVGTTVEAYPDYRRLPPYIPIDPWGIPSSPATPPTPPPLPPWDRVNYPRKGLPKEPALPWPDEPPKAPTSTLIDMPQDIRIRSVPATVSMDVSAAKVSANCMLQKYVDISGGMGFWNVRVTWPVADTWVRVYAGSPAVEIPNGGVFSTLWLDGSSMNDYMAAFTVSAVAPPDGVSTSTITFTLVAYCGLGTYWPLINKQGNTITAGCTVTVTNHIFTGQLQFDPIVQYDIPPQGAVIPASVISPCVGTGDNRTWTADFAPWGVATIKKLDGDWLCDWVTSNGVSTATYLPGTGVLTLDAVGAPTMIGSTPVDFVPLPVGYVYYRGVIIISPVILPG